MAEIYKKNLKAQTKQKKINLYNFQNKMMVFLTILYYTIQQCFLYIQVLKKIYLFCNIDKERHLFLKSFYHILKSFAQKYNRLI